jgi:hypothetical protein
VGLHHGEIVGLLMKHHIFQVCIGGIRGIKFDQLHGELAVAILQGYVKNNSEENKKIITL